MPPLSWRLSLSLCLAPALLLLAGCQRKEQTEQTNFYQRRIGPILEQACAEGPAKAGCHVRADDKGNATTKSIGLWLRSRKDRVWGQWMLTNKPGPLNVSIWSLARI